MFRNSEEMTYHCDGQASRSNTLDHFVDFISVDAKTIEGTGRRELQMGSRCQIGRVASGTY